MRKRTLFRRLAAVVLVLSLLFSMAACGKSDQGGKADGTGGEKSGSNVPAAQMPEVTVRDGVVRSTQIQIQDGEEYADGLTVLGVDDGWLYGYYYNFDGEGPAGYELVRFKADGSGFSADDLLIGENDEIAASVFANGCYYLVIASYQNSPALDYELSNQGSTELEIPDGLSEDGITTYRILCYSKDGKEKWSTDVDNPEEGDYFYVQSVQAGSDGVLLVTSEGVGRYDAETGKFIESVCEVKSEEVTGVLYALPDGNVVMMDDSGLSTKFSLYKADSGKFQDQMTLPSSLMGAIIYPGKTYDFYLAGDNGIFGAKLGSKDLKPVVNYVNSDLDIQGINTLIESEDGNLIVQAYAAGTSLETWLLQPVDPKDVKDKKLITLGGYYIDFEVRSEVIKFNKESNDYRITMTDYSEYDLDSDDFNNTTGMTRMNTDIVSGNAPDILFLSDAMPVGKYISSGIFQDLTARYESDPDIPREDFLQNIQNAFKTDQKMFVMIPGFYVTGIAGKEKYIGDGKGMTIKKVKEIAGKLGIKNSEIFGIATRDIVFESAIEFSGDMFIDEKTNTCDFNNDQFRELLEFVKDFPTEINEERYNDYFSQYLGDKALLGIQYINSVTDYEYMTRQLFGDLKVTVTGFPSSQDKGAAVAAPVQIGISSSASDPDGCWSFVRRFLLPEYQQKMESCLPVSEKALYAQGQAIIDSIKEQREAEKAFLSESLDGQEIAVLGNDKDQEKDNAAEGLTEAAAITESEDMTGKPVPREDYDGTDEEYEKYLEEFNSQSESQGGATQEEMIIAPEEVWQDEGTDTGTGLASLPDFNEDDMKALVSLIKSLNFSVNGETEVLNIIKEEAEAYFAGQKSAAEVSDIIQSRVQVYLKEKE